MSDFLPQLDSARRIYVGYSGGVDSHVLLNSLVELLGSSRVSAIHINHQLSVNADIWADHCRQVCRQLDISLICKKVAVPEEASRENAARNARYRVFEELLEDGDILTLAHHADDQAETILYRLLRHSGPRGLSGMPLSRKLGSAKLLRPLLGLDRDVLLRYAEDINLEWVEDETNHSTSFDRNFFRLKVVPHLKTRWPNYAARINSSGELCRQAESLNEELAQLDLQSLSLCDERMGWSVDISALLRLSENRQANVLRFLARQKNINPPGKRIINEVINSLIMAAEDSNPLVAWSNGEWRRYKRRLYLLPRGGEQKNLEKSTIGGAPNARWLITENLSLADGSVLIAEPVLGEGLALKYCNDLTIHFRNGHETCRPAGRAGSNGFKKLFQEYALEPWLRSAIPFLYSKGQLVAVGDLWICHGFNVVAGERGYKLRWRYPSSD